MVNWTLDRAAELSQLENHQPMAGFASLAAA
jgi:hypothetical protein